MICLECYDTDIRYDEKINVHYCNNCKSRSIAKGICKHLDKDNLNCKIGATSTGKCSLICSYFENNK